VGLIIIIRLRSSVVLIVAISTPYNANSDRKCERREQGRSESLACPLSGSCPLESFSLLFLLSPPPPLGPLSSPIVGWELEVRGRLADREFPRGIVTKLLTASRPTRARRRQRRGFSQVSRYRRRGPRHALSGAAHANFRRTKSIMERPFLCLAKEVERVVCVCVCVCVSVWERERRTRGKGGWLGRVGGPPPWLSDEVAN